MMYVETEPLRCRDCNSTRSERFYRTNEEGIRCLNCGHEFIKKQWTPSKDEQMAWTSDKTGNYF